MGAIKAHTWKYLVEHAKIAETSANKRDPPTPKPKQVTDNKNRDSTWSSQSKGKDTMAVEVTEEVRPAPRKANPGNTSGFKFTLKKYSFKMDQVVTISTC